MAIRGALPSPLVPPTAWAPSGAKLSTEVKRMSMTMLTGRTRSEANARVSTARMRRPSMVKGRVAETRRARAAAGCTCMATILDPARRLGPPVTCRIPPESIRRSLADGDPCSRMPERSRSMTCRAPTVAFCNTVSWRRDGSSSGEAGGRPISRLRAGGSIRGLVGVRRCGPQGRANPTRLPLGMQTQCHHDRVPNVTKTLRSAMGGTGHERCARSYGRCSGVG